LLAPQRIAITAWPAGENVFDGSRRFDYAASFGTAEGTLSLIKTTSDAYELRSSPDRNGVRRRHRLHILGESDLAILKITCKTPLTAFPLKKDHTKLKPLDAVMVLGFPRGFSILEGKRPNPGPALGEIRKIERNLFVTAPIIPGNSGGPVIDARGCVIGVASATFGDSTLGSCILARHILPLLPEARQLVKDAELMIDLGHKAQARLALNLVEQRGGATPEALRRLRARL